MGSSALSLLPVLLPLTGAALALLAKAFLGGRWAVRLEYAGAFLGLVLPWAALIGLAPLVLEGGRLDTVIGGWPAELGIVYRFDGLAWLVDALGLGLSGAAWLYSLGAGPRGPGFTAVFLIQTAALGATAGTADLFNLFVCLEVLGMASYVLIVLSEKPGAYLAAFSYLLVSAAAMVFFLLGVYGLYRLTGALSYEGLAAGLAALPEGGGAALAASLACIVAAVAVRVAVLPLYGWLPDAHAMAPHAVSAVLSGVLIKTPLFALARLLLALPTGPRLGELLGYAGALTALIGVGLALCQKDAKRLLAHHSISQIGYVVAAWGAGLAAFSRGEAALGGAFLAAAYLHALYHALFKGLLFMTVGTVIEACGERDVYAFRGAGLALRRAGEGFPLTVLCFAAGALSIAALPPFNGYASKTALSALFEGRWEALALYAAGVGTVASFLKLSRIFLPAPRGEAGPGPASEGAGGESGASSSPSPEGEKLAAIAFRSRPSMRLAEALLALLCLASGLAGASPARFAGRLLSGQAGFPGRLYAPGKLLSTAFGLIAGFLLFRAMDSARGKALAERIRNLPRSFHGLFLGLCLSIAILAMW